MFIVVSNLFRNACQHVQEGEITLSLEPEQLSISNWICQHDSCSDIESFGFGLHLVNSICNKLDWHFSYTEEKERVTAKLNWEKLATK